MTFGTKLKVISFIDVAAWKIPIKSPIANAINKTGPDDKMICQNAISSISIFPSKVIIILNSYKCTCERTHGHGPSINKDK